MNVGEFSVYQFGLEHKWECVASRVDAQTAVETAKRPTKTVDARTVLPMRVIITDGGDRTCFEWRYGQGVTFPT